jgi:hypothetical protein
MPADHDLLQQLRIASPCSAAWEEMQGDDRVRFCEQCRLNVYNLSAMSSQEAAALVREKEGRLCARFYARKDGTMLVHNCPVGFRAARRFLLAQLGTIGGAFALLFGSVPFLTRERWLAVRHSRLGQMEPFCSLFEALDPTPPAIWGGLIVVPTPPQPSGPTIGGNKKS